MATITGNAWIPHCRGRRNTENWGCESQTGLLEPSPQADCLSTWHFLQAPLWPGTKNSLQWFCSQPLSPRRTGSSCFLGGDHLLPSGHCWPLKHYVISAEAVPDPWLGLQSWKEVIDLASQRSGVQAQLHRQGWPGSWDGEGGSTEGDGKWGSWVAKPGHKKESSWRKKKEKAEVLSSKFETHFGARAKGTSQRQKDTN